MSDSSTLRHDTESQQAHGTSPGRIIAGKYRIEGIVGSGGMGVVMAAEHLQLKQKVAIKLISMENLSEAQQADARKRFVREGQAAARLTSDHVVRIFDVGTLDNGAPFMVMELLRGEDLATTIERQGPAPVDVAVDYLVQACDALMEAHANGIVHRDLKPANLFAARRPDGRVTIKVLDFGISKLVSADTEPLDASLTSARTVVGSPHYMSPEQVRNAKSVDSRTDIWALGAVLYELLVGARAFDADTLPGLCAAIAADAPPPIRIQRADVPEALEAVVLRCLEKDLQKRFQTVLDLSTALQPFVAAAGSRSAVEYAASVGATPGGNSLHRVHSASAETLAASADECEFSFASTRPPAVAPDPQSPSAAARRPVRSVPPESGSVSKQVLVATSVPQEARSKRTVALVGVALGIVLGVAALAAAFAHFGRHEPAAASSATVAPASASTLEPFQLTKTTQPLPGAQAPAPPPQKPVSALASPPNPASAMPAAASAPPSAGAPKPTSRLRASARRLPAPAPASPAPAAPASPEIRLER
ncbi:MAG TPA: serine/threonine-protein kinase [Polyangiales bacterium]